MHPPLNIIARVHDDFPAKFGLPRQSGLVESLKATVVFETRYRNPDSLRGLEGYSHIWLLWGFSETERDTWLPMVRPPRLGGNTPMGVFATRSPFRPNAIGMSCVRLDGIGTDEKLGPVLHVSGVDMMDGTPIYDIKPYLPYVDCHPEAVGGFSEQFKDYRLEVTFPPELLAKIPVHQQAAIIGALENDPRPAYQNDPTRRYGVEYAGFDVRFRVDGNTLTVVEVVTLKP
ncbi:MAG: tRNA (N6-threonylcarbamoyladenosine(37)-N6)-methyltransferase TrmO [Eubacteriales bacterium]|nr:tRNA (N6-threonylcarbamoyladenosine(37)-N6)-methyltransferase TrmO [Eubacteriales bacterium]